MLLTGKDAKNVFANDPQTRVDQSLPTIVRLLRAEIGLDASSLETARERQSATNTTIEESLISVGAATDRQIAAACANHYLVPLFDPGDDDISVDRGLASVLPAQLCRDHLIAPVAASGGSVHVAFFSPDGLLLIDELKLLAGMEVRPLFAPLTVIEQLLGVLFEDGEWTPPISAGGADFQELDEGREEDGEGESAVEEVLHLDQPPPPGRDGRVVRYVNQIFEQALTSGSSDIHIEPFENSCRVRLRVDGSLTEIPSPPMSMFTPVVSRIKVLAKMDIAEKRVPQDGAISLRTGERRVDMRVSTCPTVHGEKVVLRVLDKDAIPLRLTSLGMNERQESDLTESIQMPHGLMLVTGPTGSGKSTTLYSCLNLLNQVDVNICTVEDPVEYKFAGINQVQTRSQAGLSFAGTLRSFLRQDPDVIMVGEVRDQETADICIRAALTGHFVLSTLHTNDALAAVPRLDDMGIEPFLLASTLRAVVAQRLIRRLCEHCREPYQLDEETAHRLGMSTIETIYRPGRCVQCRETGHKGRVGVFEVVRITRRLADLIQRRVPPEELRQTAIQQGMKLMGQNAMARVREGQASLEEALSITVSEEG